MLPFPLLPLFLLLPPHLNLVVFLLVLVLLILLVLVLAFINSVGGVLHLQLPLLILEFSLDMQLQILISYSPS